MIIPVARENIRYWTDVISILMIILNKKKEWRSWQHKCAHDAVFVPFGPLSHHHTERKAFKRFFLEFIGSNWLNFTSIQCIKCKRSFITLYIRIRASYIYIIHTWRTHMRSYINGHWMYPGKDLWRLDSAPTQKTIKENNENRRGHTIHI